MSDFKPLLQRQIEKKLESLPPEQVAAIAFPELHDDLLYIEDCLDFANEVGADFDFLLWLMEERRLCLAALLGKEAM